LKKYSYISIPALCVPKSTYPLSNDLFIYPVFTKDRVEFQYSSKGKTASAIMLFKEQVDNSDPLMTDQIEDFVLFHSFIVQDSHPYEWYEKEFHSKLICSKESKSREEFIESIKKDPVVLLPTGIFPSDEEWDFEHFTPFIFDRKYRISYSETFNKFLKAKNERKRIYDYIRLYDFAANLSQVNTLYDNVALSLSLMYTILDDFLGHPRHCSKRLECNTCGRTDVTHDVENLAEFQNKRIGSLLESKERSIIENYQKLLKKMNEVRGATYHGAVFFSIFDEWLEEAKKLKDLGTKVVSGKLSLERVIREFRDSYLAKSQAEWLFSEFIRSLLINKLIGDRYYPILLMDLIT